VLAGAARIPKEECDQMKRGDAVVVVAKGSPWCGQVGVIEEFTRAGELVVRLADAVWAFAPHDVDNRSEAWQQVTRPAAAASRSTAELVRG
jgi:hypothetical protein